MAITVLVAVVSLIQQSYYYYGDESVRIATQTGTIINLTFTLTVNLICLYAISKKWFGMMKLFWILTIIIIYFDILYLVFGCAPTVLQDSVLPPSQLIQKRDHPTDG